MKDKTKHHLTKNIFDLPRYRSFTKEQLEETITLLPFDKQNFLKELYGNNLDKRPRRDLDDKEYVTYRSILKTITTKIETKTSPKCFKKTSLPFIYKDYSISSIRKAVSKLKKPQMILTKEIFGDTLLEQTKRELTLSEKRKFSKTIYPNIEKFLKNPNLPSENVLYFYNYFKEPKKEVYKAFTKLPSHKQKYLQELCGEDLKQGVEFLNYNSYMRFYKIIVEIRKILNPKPKTDNTLEPLEDLISTDDYIEYVRSLPIPEVLELARKLGKTYNLNEIDTLELTKQLLLYQKV